MNQVVELEPTVDEFSTHHVQTFMRVIEAAVQVRRRYQFFFWTQSHLQALVPHQFAVCGAYHRARRDVVFEAFHSIVVPQPLLNSFSDASSALMQQIMGLWIDGREQAQVIPVRSLCGSSAGADRDMLIDVGCEDLLVHGVARPQRPSEIESFFLLGGCGGRSTPQHRQFFDMVMPHMHATWLRVQATERELGGNRSAPPPPRSTRASGLITGREKQILTWVREGLSNQEIGEQLGISALTVKNHIQKILRKLSAANRAQAVAKAMTLNLLDRSDNAANESQVA
jgi:transcriptional regulator EpsA